MKKQHPWSNRPPGPEDNVPNRLRTLRFRSRLTLKELAKLLDRSEACVSRHESGRRNLDAQDIVDYARVFKCESYEIFMEPRTPPKPYTD